MWKGVVCPCPPICNDIVFPRHLFLDIFEKNRVFIFLLNEPSNIINRVSKFNYSLSFGAKQNALRKIFFAFFKDLFTKIAN